MQMEHDRLGLHGPFNIFVNCIGTAGQHILIINQMVFGLKDNPVKLMHQFIGLRLGSDFLTMGIHKCYGTLIKPVMKIDNLLYHGGEFTIPVCCQILCMLGKVLHVLFKFLFSIFKKRGILIEEIFRHEVTPLD